MHRYLTTVLLFRSLISPYFTNESYEAELYDEELARWEVARRKNRLSLFALNGGQALVIAASMTAAMILAANDKNKKILSSSIIATKYVKAAQQYLKKNGKQAQIIKLYGSMELAPILGMSDFIIDLVDTGQTLKENGLIEIENLFDVSSHMIVNKSSMKLKHDDVWCIINELENIIQAKK